MMKCVLRESAATLSKRVASLYLSRSIVRWKFKRIFLVCPVRGREPQDCHIFSLHLAA